MTYTEIAMQLPLPTMLVTGLALLNAVFRPPRYEDIDFILMLVCVGIFYFLVVWCVLLNYGVETWTV